MGKLDGKIAYIAGGAGNVGEGIVRSFLREGAMVVTSSRSSDKLDRLRELLKDTPTEKLTTIEGGLGDFEGAEALRDKILDKFARLDAVVASLGGSWHKNIPLTDVSMEDWQKFLFTNLTTHFVTLLSNHLNQTKTGVGAISMKPMLINAPNFPELVISIAVSRLKKYRS